MSKDLIKKRTSFEVTGLILNKVNLLIVNVYLTPSTNVNIFVEKLEKFLKFCSNTFNDLK